MEIKAQKENVVLITNKDNKQNKKRQKKLDQLFIKQITITATTTY